MKGSVSGKFDVKMGPLPAYAAGEGAIVGRFSLDKQFHGDLEGTSKGEMLTGGDAAKGSAAYVAIERVSGALQGLAGTFILQHTGVMNRGAPSLTITVVPDSGTGQLLGLSGSMHIDVSGGEHAYRFEYVIGEEQTQRPRPMSG